MVNEIIIFLSWLALTLKYLIYGTGVIFLFLVIKGIAKSVRGRNRTKK